MIATTHTDTSIQTEVIDELAYDPRVEPNEIGVRVKDGVVTLFGAVENALMSIAAEEDAQRVRGVKAVVNDLEVRLPAGGQRTDEEIALMAASALKVHTTIPDERVTVTVAHGQVILKGSVPWEYQRRAAESTIHTLVGVSRVVNLIEVDQPVASADIKEKIEAALVRSATTDARGIQVAVHGHTVELSGTVRSIAEQQEAIRAAWSAPGVTEVKSRLLIQL